MLTKIQIIILILSMVDLTASFFYLSTFHSIYPNQDYTKLEVNPILKMSLKHFGLIKGFLLGGIIVFGILLLVVLSMGEKFHYYLTGVLTMMCAYHFLNFKLLKGMG